MKNDATPERNDEKVKAEVDSPETKHQIEESVSPGNQSEEPVVHELDVNASPQKSDEQAEESNQSSP